LLSATARLLVWLGAASIAAGAAAQAPAGSSGIVQAALGADQRREVVENVATALESRYADAAAGARLARHLRQRLAAAAFDRHADPAGFAAALTAEMRTVVPDVHLRTVYEPGRAVAPGVAGGPRNLARIDARSPAQIARTNYGFDRVERLAGNVGYLKLSGFVPLDLSSDAATAAMAFLSNSDAVIIDLRGVPGGSPDLVQRLLSYFTGPEPVRLLATYNRAADRTDELWSLREVPGRRLTGVPLYVLQDGGSASAAEMFAYMVQRQRLGRVVGETSRGAGHGGTMVAVGSNISFFLPQMKITDGPGWEQRGILPDVAVPGADALATAHRAALRELSERASDAALKRERIWALELVEGADYAAPTAAPLAAFAGRYGPRSFVVEAGRLITVGPTGRREALTRVAENVFRTPASRVSFERGAGSQPAAVVIEGLDGVISREARTPSYPSVAGATPSMED
jgi:hypothetical protein